MACSKIVEISRRITRQLDLGKGMFLDADALAVLTECGAVELIQKAASDHLREVVAERLKAKEPEDLPARRRRPGERKSFGTRARGGSDFFEETPLSHGGGRAPGESGKEALARVQRMLDGPSRKPGDNVHVLRPRRASKVT